MCLQDNLNVGNLLTQRTLTVTLAHFAHDPVWIIEEEGLLVVWVKAKRKTPTEGWREVHFEGVTFPLFSISSVWLSDIKLCVLLIIVVSVLFFFSCHKDILLTTLKLRGNLL